MGATHKRYRFSFGNSDGLNHRLRLVGELDLQTVTPWGQARRQRRVTVSGQDTHGHNVPLNLHRDIARWWRCRVALR